MIVRI